MGRQWLAIEPLWPGSLTGPGRTGRDRRLFLEAVLWVVRTDAPCRDLPPEFGNWNSTLRRFRRWIQTHIDAVGQDGHILCRNDLPMLREHQLKVNVHRPWSGHFTNGDLQKISSITAIRAAKTFRSNTQKGWPMRA